jgi:hypothetical protein
MKFFKIITFLLFLNCATTSNLTIYSPQGEEGKFIHFKATHGSVTKDSPPSAIELKSLNEDSINVFVWAKTLDEKLKWFGFIFPIIPNIFFKERDLYKEDPNNLQIYMMINLTDTLNIIKDSIFIKIDSSKISPSQIAKDSYILNTQNPVFNQFSKSDLELLRDGRLYFSNPFVIYYPIDVHKVDTFNLYIDGLYFKEQKVKFANIEFNKSKQTFRAIGP